MTGQSSDPSLPRPDGSRESTTPPAALLWASWLVFTVLLGFGYAAIPPSPDQALFDYIGWRILGGAAPYAEVVELNWPGAMMLHTASTALFGNTLHAWRIFDYLWLVATLVLVFVVVRRAAGGRTAFWTAALYQVLYVTSGSWFSGQRDIVAAPLLLIAGVAQLTALRSERWTWQLLTGPAIALAMLIKPTLGAMAAMLVIGLTAAWLLKRISFGRAFALATVTGGSLLATLGLAAAAGAAWGVLDDWWEMSISFNSAVYTKESADYGAMVKRLAAFALPSWHWVIGAAAIGLFIPLRKLHRGVMLIAFALFGTTAISAFVQQKGFGYHLGPSLLGLALMAGGCLGACWTAWVESSRLRPVAALILIVASLGIGSKLWRTFNAPARWYAGTLDRTALLSGASGGDDGVSMADVVAVADHVRAHSKPDDTVLLWGHAVLVNFLAERRSPTRFCHAYMLWAAGDKFPRSADWAREFETNMRDDAPAFIVLTATPKGGRVWIETDEKPSPSVTLLLASLAKDYRKVLERGALRVYERQR